MFGEKEALDRNFQVSHHCVMTVNLSVAKTTRNDHSDYDFQDAVTRTICNNQPKSETEYTQQFLLLCAEHAIVM